MRVRGNYSARNCARAWELKSEELCESEGICLPLDVKRNNNHARGDAVDGFVGGVANVANDAVAEAVAHFDFGREDEVGVIKFEAEPKVVPIIDGFYFNHIVEAT